MHAYKRPRLDESAIFTSVEPAKPLTRLRRATRAAAAAAAGAGPAATAPGRQPSRPSRGRLEQRHDAMGVKVEDPSEDGPALETIPKMAPQQPTSSSSSTRPMAAPRSSKPMITYSAKTTEPRGPPQPRLAPPRPKAKLVGPHAQATLAPLEPVVPWTPTRAAISALDVPSPKKQSAPHPQRNIDKVVLGDLCFRAWYPSRYPKDIVGDAVAGTALGCKGNGGKHGSLDGKGKAGAGAGRGKDREQQQSPATAQMLDRLYVCPFCFKYSKNTQPWWEHMRVCGLKDSIPGERIYVHPKRRRNAVVAGAKTQRSEWSVWEVDGDEEVMFCQNLSLFAKLFLDNKSVLYDVSGFTYYLLMHTPAPDTATTTTTPPDSTCHSGHQIVGFFSKEKMSWDNNNLACILVFPPWQRKGLGALLMGVSYEISRREGVMGGPEKPISDLGSKGYQRFWAGEIVRWLLSADHSRPRKRAATTMTTDGDGSLTVGSDDEMMDRASREGDASTLDDEDEEDAQESGAFVVDIDQCSREIFIMPEDCLAVLGNIGFLVSAGEDARGEEDTVSGSAPARPLTGDESASSAGAGARLARLDRAAVRRWAAEHRIDTALACDPAGFVEGSVMKRKTGRGKRSDDEED